MSLNFFEYGDGRFHLIHVDREIGWLEGQTVGFACFDSAGEAHRAATVGYDALSVWLSRQRRAEAAPRRGRPLIVQRDGLDRTLTLSGVRIGRLVTPTGAPAPYGFELELPRRLYSTLVAAQVIYEGIQRYRELDEPEDGEIDDSGVVFVPTGGATP